MKYFIKSIFFCILLFLVSTTSQGQFINKIKKAASRGAEKAIEKKVEEEANKMVQKQLEKQFEGIFGEDGESSSPVSIDMNEIMKGLGEEVSTAERYDFFGHVVMEMKATDKKGKEQDPTLLKSYLAKTSDYTGMEITDPKNEKSVMTMVYDIPNQASILLMDNDGSKNSFAYKIDINEVVNESMEDMEDPMEDSELVIEKTGNTKEILGYQCDEYHVKSRDGEGTYWVTEEPIGGYTSFWGTNSPFASGKDQSKYAEYFNDFPQGNFMEMTFISEDDGTKVELKVIEINDSESKSFLMSDYPNVMTQASQN
ncbi:DUF4412 domain-containing protein [Algoriphagus halophilus]|uniref:DUF4412 domain-containing protein n=1 Tax=Algoriphagus halophilus TaxID=226505 RepID=A0A1N6DLK0_9BACT|nr:DUF4412 domain-containing protein [Algoriphagus halophilus]SIN71711.1 protein of unknown function [Algoriphagus halophilus]